MEFSSKGRNYLEVLFSPFKIFADAVKNSEQKQFILDALHTGANCSGVVEMKWEKFHI
ncbi:MAG: hypothetical protein RE471_01020 [Ferroplasma sp.]|uniref:hypothetical protein n=1 Tax=Ferroplasma sp. TaxID=2591003 RepID=UPI00281670CE|nr:hypothetical protein [Ferroplasma sp.]WMT51477.1 MAG: hypothetical protein RE471_01020 [Ferroplasma sp.]